MILGILFPLLYDSLSNLLLSITNFFSSLSVFSFYLSPTASKSIHDFFLSPLTTRGLPSFLPSLRFALHAGRHLENFWVGLVKWEVKSFREVLQRRCFICILRQAKKNTTDIYLSFLSFLPLLPPPPPSSHRNLYFFHARRQKHKGFQCCFVISLFYLMASLTSCIGFFLSFCLCASFLGAQTSASWEEEEEEEV